MPLLVTISSSSIVSFCPNVRSMPYACAMKSVAKVQYIIEPSRLNE